ncbi:MAG: hypothetical protein KME16_24480 [Scytolyngbya sp. HA4215-MV1]|jgi:hypothetical protein|nr:hypothetical protein [Scytolyngbya sp. HA4215-MV1]
MKHIEPLENPDIKRLQRYLYFVPVFGAIPALWTLFRGKGDRQERAFCRLALILALSWLLGYSSLGTGAQASESLALPLSVLNTLFTSSYFVVNLWLMVQIWQRKPLSLPGIGRLVDAKSSKKR